MNRVMLVGRLTRDPELRTTPSGLAVTRFSVAVSQNFTNRNGERGTDFINCVAWDRQADFVSRYCKKGSLVSVEGRISTGNYTAQDGTKRYTTDVVCEQINFLSRSSNDNSRTDNNNNTGNPQREVPDMPMDNPMETADLTEDPFKSFGEEITLSSDDLPF